MTAHWYALHSKPNKEQFLCGQLTSKGIEAFYPRLKANPANPRARKFKPYFPSYLFIRIDLEETSALSIHWMAGATGFVSFGAAPAIVPDELIHAIQKRVEQINAKGGEVFDGLKRGDAVSIQSGAFAGSEAIFDEKLSGGERVRVLLKLLGGRAVKVELPAGMLEKKRA
ncbi:MAG: transcription/translation regulatory transformer protein RfaH [Anaerolineales bacterium]